jgi:uncharacterized protein (TIGR04255 family)
MTLPSPFGGPPPPEVQLPRSPLVRVLAQVRFPAILNIAKADFVAPFQNIVRAEYPALRSEVLHSIQLAAPDNQPAVDAVQIWRFEDKDHNWRISLARDFVALETTRYTSRTEFLSRMNSIIEALQTTLDPQLTQRVGLRYIDRLQGEAMDALRNLIKPQFLMPNEFDYESVAIHILTQALFNSDEGAKINARWGHVPAGVTIDPIAIEPINEPSWIMDFDMFSEAERSFSAQELTPLLASFAERTYSVFRSMVTDQFLEFYGGQL